MNANLANIQDRFLNRARKNKTQLTVYLMNGFQIKGVITDFDQFVVVITDNNSKQNVIYKHAISTITPVNRISLLPNDGVVDEQDD